VSALVEITARFDEASNMSWGKRLERAGVHVVYGMERLKTHVKAALVVRAEKDGIRHYFHVGTGNYHPGTARIYEDLGILSCDPELGTEVATLFNELTGAVKSPGYKRLLVAPTICSGASPSCFDARFSIRKKAPLRHSRQDESAAGSAHYPRTLSCRPGGRADQSQCSRSLLPACEGSSLSKNIRVFSTIGRFLEHGRIYRFENGGNPEFFIGSADWMRRNLFSRMECIMPVKDPISKRSWSRS